MGTPTAAKAATKYHHPVQGEPCQQLLMHLSLNQNASKVQNTEVASC
jgi:hypothetical protein